MLETPGFVCIRAVFMRNGRARSKSTPGAMRQALPDLTASERDELAGVIKTIRMKYDNLWGFPIPLMMTVRQLE